MKDIEISKAASVLEVFRHRIVESMSIMQISKLLKLSYEPTYRRVRQMQKQGCLEKKSGKYKINLKNSAVIKILEFLADQERKKILKKYKKLQKLNQLIDFSEKKSSVSYIILFGSYAKGRPEKNSDIDLFIVLERNGFKKTKKQIETIFSFVKETNISEKYEVSPIFAQTSDVKEMIDERKPIMSDIIREGMVIFGEGKYYRDMAKYLKDW